MIDFWVNNLLYKIPRKEGETLKALIEVEIIGDFEVPLTNESVIDILGAVIVDGAYSAALTGKYKIIEIKELD